MVLFVNRSRPALGLNLNTRVLCNENRIGLRSSKGVQGAVNRAEKQNSTVRDDSRPTTVTLVRGFLAGACYLLFAAKLITVVTEHSLLAALAISASSALAVFSIALVLLVRRAMGDEGRPWQIHLSSLFLIVAVVSIYLAVMRWLASGIDPELPNDWWVVLLGLSVTLIILGIPFVLFLGESLLWLAVWIIRRRTVRWLLRAVLRLPGGRQV
jgi:hypothetical protein